MRDYDRARACLMSDYARRRRCTETSGSGSGSSGSEESVSNAEAIEEMPKEQVMIYLTQNSVTHHNDEIPETLAALKKADDSGLGKKSMIPSRIPSRMATRRTAMPSVRPRRPA